MRDQEKVFESNFAIVCRKCGYQKCEIDLKTDNEGAELHVYCPICSNSNEIHETEITQ